MSPAVLLLIALSAPGGNLLPVGDHTRELKIGDDVPLVLGAHPPFL